MIDIPNGKRFNALLNYLYPNIIFTNAVPKGNVTGRLLVEFKPANFRLKPSFLSPYEPLTKVKRQLT